jgi:cytidyltransferase-like protein
MLTHRKILTHDALIALREQARERGQTLVHCHGCFDIVHPGHISHLQFARSLGDLLIVTVSADAQVNKGADRPLIPQELRAGSLAALECVVCESAADRRRTAD